MSSSSSLCLGFLFSFLVAIVSGNAHADSNGNGFVFIGDQHWSSEMKRQCDDPTNAYFKDPAVKCYMYTMKDTMEIIRTELLSRDPLLIVYRGFAKENHIRAFLDDVDKKDLVRQTVVDRKSGGNEESTSRRANGSWIKHEELPGVAAMFQRAQKVIPNINFRSAESWSVLSYHPGGHYAPHFDYLQYSTPDHWDSWMKNYGNRISTFLVVLKTADVGGGTVFPKKDITVIPEAGDVIFWMNMNTDESLSNLSMHGACVIKEGRKIAATLWIRQKDQPILVDVMGSPFFDPKHFVNPSSFTSQCSV